MVSASRAVLPGTRVPVRVILETPIVARAGDRFVLRTPSPATTIGGGMIEDPLPPHRRARGAGIADSALAHLERLVAEASTHGLEVALIPVRLGIAPADVPGLVASAGETVVQVGGRVYAAAAARSLRMALLAVVDDHHRTSPLDPGVPLQSVRSKLSGSSELIDAVLAEALASREVALDGGLLRRAGWRPVLSSAEVGLSQRLLATLQEAGREPPGVAELMTLHGDRVAPLLRLLEREGAVTPVEVDRYFATGVIERLIEDLRRAMVPGREYGPAELRDIIGVSRKYLIPLLEYCDRTRVTDRRSGGRVIVGTQFASQTGDKRS